MMIFILWMVLLTQGGGQVFIAEYTGEGAWKACNMMRAQLTLEMHQAYKEESDRDVYFYCEPKLQLR